MKIRYSLLLLALAAFIFAFVRYLKSDSKPATVSENAAPTDFRFAKTLMDVGAQKYLLPVRARFVIYNVGKHNLYIQTVVPDCHCTVADFSEKPIEPNDSSIITLKFDASHQGSFQSSAVVSTNSAASPTLLVFRGVVH
jgi:hypothetical protein